MRVPLQRESRRSFRVGMRQTSPTPLAAAFLVAALLAPAGCASVPAPRAPQRLFAVAGHALGPSERHFVLASDWPYRSVSGGFTEPVRLAGVVLAVGHRTGPLARAFDAHFRGRVEIALLADRERVSIQFDAPEGPIPVEPGQWVRIEAHALAEEGRPAYFLSVHDRAGKLLFAAYSGSHFDSAMRIPGWSFALGPAVDTRPICGGEMSRRTVRVIGPGGEAFLWPGYRSVAPLGSGGDSYEVDVLAARSADVSCLEAQRAEVVSVVLRRALP